MDIQSIRYNILVFNILVFPLYDFVIGRPRRPHGVCFYFPSSKGDPKRGVALNPHTPFGRFDVPRWHRRDGRPSRWTVTGWTVQTRFHQGYRTFGESNVRVLTHLCWFLPPNTAETYVPSEYGPRGLGIADGDSMVGDGMAIQEFSATTTGHGFQIPFINRIQSYRTSGRVMCSKSGPYTWLRSTLLSSAFPVPTRVYCKVDVNSESRNRCHEIDIPDTTRLGLPVRTCQSGQGWLKRGQCRHI